MARKKGASKSNDSDHGNRSRQRIHNEIKSDVHTRTASTENINADSMSSATVSSRNNHHHHNHHNHNHHHNHHHHDIDYKKSPQNENEHEKEMNPPIIFNNKYLHKKFKRLASTDVEDNSNSDKFKPNANNLAIDNNTIQYRFNNGEAITDIGQLHINEQCQDRLTNKSNPIELTSCDDLVRCIRCQRPFKDKSNNDINERTHLCLQCQSHVDIVVVEHSSNIAIDASIRNNENALHKSLPDAQICDVPNVSSSSLSLSPSLSSPSPSSSTMPHRSMAVINEMDSMRHLAKNNIENTFSLIPVAPLQQKTNKPFKFDALHDDTRLKTMPIHTIVPQNLKENLSYEPIECAGPARSINCTNTSVRQRKHMRAHHLEKPYPSKLELKYKSNLYGQCRSQGHALKTSHTSNDQDLEITQSTSSDLELSSCSTTTGSDAVSRSTTPLEDHSHASSSGIQNSSVASIQDKPYKPKFHKAAFYHTSSTSNATNSAPDMSDSKTRLKSVIKTKSFKERLKDDDTKDPMPTYQPRVLSQTPNVEEYISKLISKNRAIMDNVEPPLQKKYHKITGISRGGNIQSTESSSLPKQHLDDSQKFGINETNAHSATEMQRGIIKSLPTLQQQAQQVLKKVNVNDNIVMAPLSPQPLNLTSDSINESQRKRSIVNDQLGNRSIISSTMSAAAAAVASTSNTEPNIATQSAFFENHHPQNPERSIIKSLLLNSRGLAVPTTGEGDDAVYICPLCKTSFRSADDLQYHTKCCCQGAPHISIHSQINGSPISNSAPISPVGSPSHKYFRSNSFNLQLPEKYSPNTLAKLASSSLRHHTPLSLAKLAAHAQQAAGYYLNKTSMSGQASTSTYATHTMNNRNVNEHINKSSIVQHNTSSATSSSPYNPNEVQSVSSQCVQITKLIDASLPSPGPLLGKTRLVDHYNVPRETIKTKQDVNVTSLSNKSDVIVMQAENAISLVDRMNNKMLASKESQNMMANDDLFSPKKQQQQQHQQQLQQAYLPMCGGDVKIVEKKGENIPRLGSSGGSIVSISSSPDSLTEHSPVSIRAGLHSGGSIIESVPPKRKVSVMNMSSMPLSGSTASQSAKYPYTNLPRINNEQGIMSNYFQFPPPINPITAYNPLTLPTKQPEFNTDVPTAIEATKIVHGGKIIPFVPGIPGPNSLATNLPLSPIVQSDRLYNTNQTTLSYNNNVAHKSFPIGLNSMRLKSSSLSPRTRTVEITLEKSQTPELSKMQENNTAENYTITKPKTSPNSIESNIQSSGSGSGSGSGDGDSLLYNYAYNLTTTNTNEKQSAISFAHGNRSKIISMPMRTISHDEKVNVSDFDESTKSTLSDHKMDTVITVNSSYPFNLSREPTNRESGQISSEKPFNFMRIADNLSPPKMRLENKTVSKYDMHTEKVKSKLSSQTHETISLYVNIENVDLPRNEIEKESPILPAPQTKITPKFLRPSSLPLKPGTFTPKKHHGITPTSNTFALISPETPRPSKNCVQMYLNGNAYTYLGLKCSTKTFYCTVNRPQPVHFSNQPKLSIYSNWQTCAENNPCGFAPREIMSLYDSRQRQLNSQYNCKYTIANRVQFTTLHSQSVKLSQSELCSDLIRKKTDENQTMFNQMENDQRAAVAGCSNSTGNIVDVPSTTSQPTVSLIGGYKSNEDYTYIRGRGRGRYVCNECGIRCKKPSMLKKHIRTHSDDRPFACRRCKFSFKTKGNLTKHLSSKAHKSKVQQSNEEDDMADDTEIVSTSTHNTNLPHSNEEGSATESDESSDGEDAESSDNEDAKLPDHEAAHCLLSLSQRSHGNETDSSLNGLVPNQPMTSPYVKNDYKNQTKSHSNEFMRNQLHDTLNKTDLAISKNSPNALNDNCNVVTSTLDLTIHNESNRQRRISVGSLDAIDLSKPRSNVIVSVNDAKEKITADTKIVASTPGISTAGFLNSLMMLSDKVRPSSPASLDYTTSSYDEQHQSNPLLQSYLTERALQKSKMKLSQVTQLSQNAIFTSQSATKQQSEKDRDSFSPFALHKVETPIVEHVIVINAKNDDFRRETNASMLQPSPSKDERQCKSLDVNEQNDEEMPMKMPETISENSTTDDHQSEQNSIKIELQISKSINENLTHSNNLNDHSSMDTLAEIAANSVKLDAKLTQSSNVAVSRESSTLTSTATLTSTTTTTSSTSTTTSASASASASISTRPIQTVPTSYNVSPKPISKPPVQNEQPTSWKEISAKNIASEFLKLANEQDNYSISNTDMDDSSSSNSDITNESTNKQGRRSSLVSLGSAQDVLISARTVVVGEDGFKTKSSNPKDLPMVALPRGGSSNTASRPNVAFIQEDGGPSKCTLCSATFPKKHQLVLHMNIHYMNPERKFRCNSCGINFHSHNRLQKHLRSDAHHSKATMVETMGTSTSKNPRPFECTDCNRAFRIHGHLAKHLRSKTHVQKLECLQKLPFGTYAMIEEAHINLTDIDTTDCDNSLASLKKLAEKLKFDSTSPDKGKSTLTTANYDNYTSDANSNDECHDLDGKNADDASDAEKHVSATKKRRINDDCNDMSIGNEKDDN